MRTEYKRLRCRKTGRGWGWRMEGWSEEDGGKPKEGGWKQFPGADGNTGEPPPLTRSPSKHLSGHVGQRLCVALGTWDCVNKRGEGEHFRRQHMDARRAGEEGPHFRAWSAASSSGRGGSGGRQGSHEGPCVPCEPRGPLLMTGSAMSKETT